MLASAESSVGVKFHAWHPTEYGITTIRSVRVQHQRHGMISGDMPDRTALDLRKDDETTAWATGFAGSAGDGGQSLQKGMGSGLAHAGEPMDSHGYVPNRDGLIQPVIGLKHAVNRE